MGQCNRNGCNNYARKYSSSYGYICDECFEEIWINGCCDIMSFMLSQKNQLTDRDLWEESLNRTFFNEQ
jgi:hypothetical protein